MQFHLSFSLLLASILFAIASSNVEAAPAKRGAGMVTLPLKRIHGPRSDIHPQVLLQQHINRGNRRLARMTGRQEPTREEQLARLHKRMYLLENGLPGSRNGKRYNRQGVTNANVATTSNKGNIAAKVDDSDLANEVAAILNGNENAGVSKAKAAAKSQSAGGAAASGSAAATNSTANPGVSPIDIKAAAADSLTAAGNPTADNSLGLDIEANDVGYIATVQIGTPARDFKILMDSGSADFWVGAEQCQEVVQQANAARAVLEARQSAEQARSESSGFGSFFSRLGRRKGGSGATTASAAAAAANGQGGQTAAANACGNHQFLGTQSSSSFVDTQKPFQVTYGSGAVVGTIVTDNLNMAGLALDQHTFGTAQGETVQFTGAPFDGLMGLAQSTLSEQQTLTPVESLAKNGLINDAITSYKISRLADQKNDGEVTFGGLDQTKFDANTLTTFDNVNQQGFWEGDMASVTVNGQDAGLQGRTAILDTGTTLIIAPAADAAAVHQLIQGAQSDGQGGFIVPCTLTDSVALTFGGTSFAIDPRDIAQSPVDPNNPTGDCTSGISSGNVGGATEWLVGDVFLKNAYFSTDVARNQISLAKLV